MNRHEGFSIVEGLLVVAVLVVTGTVGYLAYTNLLAPKAPVADTAGITTTSAATAQPVKVEDTKDLDTVNAQLNQLNVDDSDSSQLDSAASTF